MHVAERRSRTRSMVVTALMGALVVVLGMTPLGFIPVPTPAGSATTIHIPVILAALAEGPLAGAVAGFLFGTFSYWQALTHAANPVARVMFSDPLVAFVPRILIGLVAWAAFRAARHRAGRAAVAALVALALGDATYRLAGGLPTSVRSPYPGVTPAGLVASLAVAAASAWLVLRWLRQRDVGPALAALAGSLTNTVGVLGLVTLRGYLPWQLSLGIAVVQGLPEALVAMVLTVAVYRGLRRSGLVAAAGGTVEAKVENVTRA
ncbi:MAG: ECF transporter S component [Clostridia bacterium]|nr:ECF transporter S component [Clostridia bacterium]MCL6521128.1 ECF transporter S component [Bacillota bacterium]